MCFVCQVWGAVSTWTADNITAARGIVSGLDAADIDNLNLNNLDAIAAIGNGGMWTKDKVGEVLITSL